MRNIYWTLLLFLCIWGKSTTAQVNSYLPNYNELNCHQNKIKNTVQENALTSNYDVTYYQLKIQVAPSKQYIDGSVDIHFKPKAQISEMYFELHPDLIVDSVKYQGQSIPFLHTDFLVKVNHTFNASQITSIRIFYHGAPPEGASFKTELQNDIPILWTLSEPYGARDWWPCKQSLTDKADSVDIFITCPQKNKVASNGILENIIQKDSLVTFHWKHRYPIAPYLVAIAVTEYAEINFVSNLSSGNLPVQNYIYSADSLKHRQQIFTTDTLLQYYDTLIGTYPFMKEKYGHAQWGRGGGMEHQTMSFMYHFGFNLNAHELAHQWFGNKITCGSWQDIWLNEGFATYFAGLPLETWYEGKYWNEWKSSTLTNALRNNTQSIFVEDTSTFERIFDPNLSYAKGAYVLHMLRKQVGDNHFFTGIRSYLKDENLAYKTALTQDFFQHMEVAADTQLQAFKNQWIYGIGYPSFNVEWFQIGSDVEMTIRQTTSNSVTPFFNLSVPILLIGESDSLWILPNPKTNEETFQWKVTFPIRQIVIDPEQDLISKGNFVIQKPKFSSLTIYPNPTSQKLVIVPSSDFRNIEEYQIISSTGKLVKQSKFTPTNNSLEIDVSQITQGAYRIVLKSENSQQTEAFVISR